MIIIDTSYIISNIVETDIFHKTSVNEIQSIHTSGEIFSINNYVLAELITLANLKFPKHKGNIFAYVDDILNKKVPGTLYYSLSDSDYIKTLEVAKAFEVSFADGSLIVLALKYYNSRILTFDKAVLKAFETIKSNPELTMYISEKKTRYQVKAKQNHNKR